MIRIILLLAAVAAPLVAQENAKRDIAKIAAISNDIERLAAYDAYAKQIGAAPDAAVTTAKIAQWKMRKTVSPVDDSESVEAGVSADADVSTKYGKKRPALIVRHQEGTTDAFVAFDAFLGMGEVELTLRFDRDPAYTQAWHSSTDHKAAFVPIGYQKAFFERLATADTLLVRVTPYGENPTTVTFPVSGAKEPIEAIRAAEAKLPAKN